MFGWFYDITAAGIVRTPDRAASAAEKPRSLQPSDHLVLAAIAAIAVIIVYDAITDILQTPRGPGTGQTTEQDPVAMEKAANSIAVLPFANVSNDPQNEAFCDGISEEILHKLGKFAGLHVIGRTSSFAFKGSNYRIPRISALLGVRFVLQGSVRKQGEQLRITAQLVDDSGVQQWGDAYDRKLEDIFTIQTEIADIVASTVVPKISPVHATRREPDLAAYQHYLAGRELFHRREDGAVDELARAIELDPGFAEAHAEYAITRLVGHPSPADTDAAGAAIQTALGLEPALPRALAAKGLLRLQKIDPDFVAAEAILRDVLGRDPGMVDAMNWLGSALASQGRYDEALSIYERALAIDPLHGSIAVNVAGEFFKRGAAQRAEEIFLRLVNLPKPVRFAFVALRDMYADQGRLVDMNIIEKRLALTGLHVYWGLAWNYSLLGLPEQASYWAERSRRDFSDVKWVTMYPSILLAIQGRYADALATFQRALAARGWSASDFGWFAEYFVGELQAQSGDFQEAAAMLEPVVAGFGAVDAEDENALAARLVLAWSYNALGRQEEAGAILERIERNLAELRASGRGNSAQTIYLTAEVAILRGDLDIALDRLEQAVEAGWREYYTRRHDPRWVILADDPRFRALMERVRVDVDRQRETVLRIDAEENFPARLDRARSRRGNE